MAEPEIPIEATEDPTEDDVDYLFVPKKKVKRIIDHELSLYASMYENDASDRNPLNFWKRVEKVSGF